MAANLFVKDVLFDWEPSLIDSGVLPVFSLPLHIGENSIDFTSCTSVFGIRVDSVVFFRARLYFTQVSLDQFLQRVQTFLSQVFLQLHPFSRAVLS